MADEVAEYRADAHVCVLQVIFILLIFIVFTFFQMMETRLKWKIVAQGKNQRYLNVVKKY